MTTIGQFNRAWLDFTLRSRANGYGPEIMDKILPAFRALAAAFEKQFGTPIHSLDKLPKDKLVRGETLEKLKAWIERIKITTGLDYGPDCGLAPLPETCLPVELLLILIYRKKIKVRRWRKPLHFKPRRK